MTRDLRLTAEQRETLCGWIADVADKCIERSVAKAGKPTRGSHAIKAFAEGLIEVLHGTDNEHPAPGRDP